MHFGDRPAACQLEVSKRKIAKLGEKIDPQASAKLIQCAVLGRNSSVAILLDINLEHHRAV